MSETKVKERRDDFIDTDGPWTAHSVHLGDNIYTFGPHVDSRLRRFVQIAADIVEKPLNTVRVLDLACLEGHFSIEFALHGASVVAIEGREINLRKAQFAANLLSIRNIKFVLDDVRNLSRDRYGEFDVVLCLGILYHLDAPDAMEFLKNIFEVCGRVAIIDTHFATADSQSYIWNGKTYWGYYAQEHSLEASQEQQVKQLWDSIGNLRSFHLTRASLYNLFRHVGFTSAYECLNPYQYTHPEWPLPAKDGRHVVEKTRSTFVVIKGRRQHLISSPITEASAEIDRPETPEYLGQLEGPGRQFSQTQRAQAQRLLRILPRHVRKLLRKMYQRQKAGEESIRGR
jgi:SAM-dependent methyltransferase